MITADRLQIAHAQAIAFTKARAALAENPKWRPLPHQVPPPEDGDWVTFLIMAGRGSGKTDAAAHYVDSRASASRIRIAIAAPTLGDARSICVEGETGILNANPLIQFNRSSYELTWPNGSKAKLFGAYSPEDVERWRGPQHALVWCEEMASWRHLSKCWDMMRLGLRLGDHPRIVISTTPKPVRKIKELLADPLTVVSRGTTDDNPYLHADVRAELQRQYGGTRLGRQELGGELLEDIEGALWQYGWIEQSRVREHPNLRRVVVTIDPAATSSEDADETGIVVAGLGDDGDFYVLEAHGVRLSPHGWANRALDLYDTHRADKIIAEVNNGGEMVVSTIRSVRLNAPVESIHASRGKTLRAEPVASLYEQGRVHHCGMFGPLEDQQCSFPVASEHDDLVDALVYAITELADSGPAAAQQGYDPPAATQGPARHRLWR